MLCYSWSFSTVFLSSSKSYVYAKSGCVEKETKVETPVQKKYLYNFVLQK